MLEMLMTGRSVKDIEERRARIIGLLSGASATLKDPQPTSISTADLRLLFGLYDEIFLGNWFRDNYKGKMKFSLSGRMTKSAGKMLCPKNIERIRQEELVIEIRLGVDFFLDYGRHFKGCAVCGVKTHNALEALLLVFEHELCHVLEFLLFGKSSCKGKRFKTLARNIFGHTQSYHELPTNKQIAARKFGLRPGDAVTFEFQDKRLEGFIQSINKRATVMVPDNSGAFADRKGKRYAKFYVPLAMLKAMDA